MEVDQFSKKSRIIDQEKEESGQACPDDQLSCISPNPLLHAQCHCRSKEKPRGEHTINRNDIAQGLQINGLDMNPALDVGAKKEKFRFLCGDAAHDRNIDDNGGKKN